MSFADWERPADTQMGPVLLIGIAPTSSYAAHFRGCEQVGTIDNIVANDEDGAALARCDSPAEPWSTLWPKLRRYY